MRVRPVGMVVSISVAAVLMGLGGHPLAAQAPSNDSSGLLRPMPDGSPATLRRNARKPDRATRTGRPAQQVPTFGNPPGFGAGTTGFNSTNPRPAARPLRPGQRTPAATAAAPLAIGPRTTPLATSIAAQANATVLAPEIGLAAPLTLPLPMDPPRAGRKAEPPLPGPDIRGPIRRRLGQEDDPFAPTTVHVGNFFVAPAVEILGGYDSNPRREPGGRGSSTLVVAPELKVRSDWSRHQLNADLRGSYTTYGEAPSENRPFLDAKVNGRIDASRQTRIDVEGRYLIQTDNPGSPDIPAGLTRLPTYSTIGGTAGVTQRFNRFEVTAKTGIDRIDYENSEFTNGAVASNEDRNYTQYSAALRTAYELSPAMKPFAEVAGDTRIRDLPVDVFGVQRDSVGSTARVGTTFEFSRKFYGEVSAGYLVRTYKDPNLPDLQGVIGDASLIWAATPLTTFKLTAASPAGESTVPGVSGVLRRDAALQIDHAFRRWLIVTTKAGFGLDMYEGGTREDTRYFASLGLTYKLTREVYAKGELRQEWLRSNVPGVDYTATVALVGVRLQR